MEEYCRAEQATDNNIIWCKHIACWIIKATDTQPEFARHIASPWRKQLCERASKLPLYLHCLSFWFYQDEYQEKYLADAMITSFQIFASRPLL